MLMPMKISNHKIGDDTLIFNLCSSHNCPSKRLELCQLENPDIDCYGMNDEVFRPRALHYRNRQEFAWNCCSSKQIAEQIIKRVEGRRTTPLEYLRVSEAGDLKTQRDVAKLVDVAKRLDGLVVTYVYTARSDLNFSKRGPLVVNGSGFMVDNAFNIVPVPPKRKPVCVNNCRLCDMCKEKGGRTIYAKFRRRLQLLNKGGHHD